MKQYSQDRSNRTQAIMSEVIPDRNADETALERHAAERSYAMPPPSMFLAAMEASIDGIALVGADETFVYMNQAYAEIYGYNNPDDLIGTSWRQLYDEDEIARFEQEVLPILREKGQWRGETKGKRQDGSTFDQEVTLTVLEEGRLICVCRDITERKQAEKALRESEGRYRILYSETPVMMHSSDHEGRLISVNDYWLKVLGYERGEVIGRKSNEFLTEESRRHFYEVTFPAYLKTGAARDVAYQMVKKNGEVIDVLLSASAEKDEEGKIRRSLAFIVDVTDQRRAEEASRESEERYRDLYDNAPLAYLSVGTDGRICMANTHASELLGYAHEDLIGSPVFDLYADTPAGKERATTIFQRFVTGEEPQGEELQMRKADGRLVWISLTVRAIRDQQGEIVESRSMVMDITERQQAEEALQRAHDELELRVEERTAELSTANRNLKQEITERKQAEASLQRHARRLETLQELDRAILTAQSSGEIADGALHHIQELIPFLRASVTIFDFEREEGVVIATQTQDKTKVGRGTWLPLRDFVIPEPLRQGEVIKVDDIDTMDRETRIFDALRAEGLRSFLSVPLVDRGDLIGMLNLGADRPAAFSDEHVAITREVADPLAIAIQQAQLYAQIERHAAELEQRVKERTAELEAFSYSVSHDLRTPLRAVDGFSRVLVEDYADVLDDECQRLIHIIRSNAQNMGQLIDGLLAFSRIGRREMQLCDVNVHKLVEEVYDDLRATTEERTVHFEVQPLPPARGDRSMLRQVFVNLLSNALKFTRSRPEAMIEVGAEEAEQTHTYWVKDNGVGFEQAYVDKLFGVFQRLHTVEEFEGTGVGLAIVQRIIARHGGRVWAEGRVGEGATLYFTLPKGEGKQC